MMSKTLILLASSMIYPIKLSKKVTLTHHSAYCLLYYHTISQKDLCIHVYMFCGFGMTDIHVGFSIFIAYNWNSGICFGGNTLIVIILLVPLLLLKWIYQKRSQWWQLIIGLLN